MFRCNHRYQGAHYLSLLKLNLLKQSIKKTSVTILTIVTLASSNSALHDDGDYTETCWSRFNVNFNTPFKAILLCISW
jgi:hypothetical protein